MNDNGITEKCLFDLYKDFNTLKLSQRNFINQSDSEFQELGRVLSTDALRLLLKAVNDMESAFWISETIKASWKAHPNISLRIRLDHGIAHLLKKQRVQALDTFQNLIKEDPQYGEAWNMLATCYFMSDQRILSQEAAKAALSVIPEHFQAMSALGMIQSQEHDDDMAANTFRKILELDPWSQVSTKLTECMKHKRTSKGGLDEINEA
jgi:cytochrome c-type biogenesis protein CcmH/NrfG